MTGYNVDSMTSNNGIPRKTRKKQERVVLSDSQLLKAKSVLSEELKENPDFLDLPTSSYTVDNLVDFFVSSLEGSKKLLPKEKRKYVMYLRKSTDAEERQVRSLEDQEVECMALARQLKIHIKPEDIFKESASAKEPGKRPVFDKVMLGFKTGKYQGLIAWSPDRLSRNMLEGGQIIEMVDHEEIQDLLFRTYQFDNTPNGKMLLGILFATSKQYSDKLSQDVKRGITGAVRDGKYLGVMKKGYYKDSNTGYYVKDEHNWRLLRKAVLMRIKDRATGEEIAKFLNDSHLSVRKTEQDDYQLVKMTKNMVSELFKDEFYIGVYKHGCNIANLNDQYNFLTLVTPDEYITLSRTMSSDFGKEFKGRGNVAQKLEFGLLREKVICDFCNRPMNFQRTKIQRGKNKGKWLLSFYCRNKDCIRHKDKEAISKYGHKLNKSIRAKYINAHIEWTLRHLTNNVDEAHRRYIERIEMDVIDKKATVSRKLSDAKKDSKLQRDFYSKYQNFQVSDSIEYKKHHNGKLEYHQSQIMSIEEMVSKLEDEKAQLNKALPTREEFVELINSYLETILKTTDVVEEDLVYREIVLNLRANDDFISVIKLNPPYDMMVDLNKKFL